MERRFPTDAAWHYPLIEGDINDNLKIIIAIVSDPRGGS
jgi:hypothetical protein